MVIGAAAFVAQRKPVAKIAELHRLWVGLQCTHGCLFEIVLSLSEKSDVARHPKFNLDWRKPKIARKVPRPIRLGFDMFAAPLQPLGRPGVTFTSAQCCRLIEPPYEIR